MFENPLPNMHSSFYVNKLFVGTLYRNSTFKFISIIRFKEKTSFEEVISCTNAYRRTYIQLRYNKIGIGVTVRTFPNAIYEKK